MTPSLPTTVGTQTLENRSSDAMRHESRVIPHAVHLASGRAVRQEIRSATSATEQQHSYESASRLISETAHDLRAPLSTIREAVRLVRDGDLGNVTSTQNECLSAAINQCNCAVQLVDEMVQSRQFDSGFPNVRRQWISLDELRQEVEATLQPWMLPRDIHLLWDGPYGRGVKTYADATLLRRLIVNLAGNAIRVTREGGAVLIRAQAYESQTPDSHGQMTWSVVDQGAGISPADLELINAGKAPTKSIGGLGLMISRQLASAHFSNLRIESRLGTGTAVNFQTTVGGPAAVAENYVAWRSSLLQCDSAHASEQHVHDVVASRQSRMRGKMSPPRRVRIDAPSQVIELGVDHLQPAFPDHVYLTTVSVGAAIPAKTTDDFDSLLQRSMRMTEIAYRTGHRSWAIAWDADGASGTAKRSDLERMVQNELEGVRMTWGAGSVVSEDSLRNSSGSLRSRLSDLMVRQTLFASQHAFSDADQVRLGTSPMPQSTVPSMRLDNEVNWLGRNSH